MTAAFMLSIACRTAFAAQSPSAIRLACAFSSLVESPTEAGSTVLCTAFRASSSEMSAPVLASVVAPSRSAVTSRARTDDSWAASFEGHRCVGKMPRTLPSSARRTTTLHEALVESAPYPLAETCHSTLRLLALPLRHDDQRLVQQADFRGIGVPNYQPPFAHTFVGARDFDALHQRELHQQGTAECHVHLGAGRCQLSGVVVRQEE